MTTVREFVGGTGRRDHFDGRFTVPPRPAVTAVSVPPKYRDKPCFFFLLHLLSIFHRMCMSCLCVFPPSSHVRTDFPSQLVYRRLVYRRFYPQRFCGQKPWSQVSPLLPSATCLHFIAHTYRIQRFSIPPCSLIFIKCCRELTVPSFPIFNLYARKSPS